MAMIEKFAPSLLLFVSCSFKLWGRYGFDWVLKIFRAGQRAAKVSVKTLNLISANTDTFSDFALAA